MDVVVVGDAASAKKDLGSLGRGEVVMLDADGLTASSG
jgi:hypothetical protein